MKYPLIHQRFPLVSLFLAIALLFGSQAPYVAAQDNVFRGDSSVTTYEPGLLGPSTNLILQNANGTNKNFSILSFADANRYGIAHVGAINVDHVAHAGQLFFATKPPNGNLTQRMLIDEVGKVVIGATQAWATFDVRLQDTSRAVHFGDGADGLWFLNGTSPTMRGQFADSAPSLLLMGRTTTAGDTGNEPLVKIVAEMRSGSSNVSVAKRPLFAVSNRNSQAALLIDASNNVGIGTTSPSSKLHVNGTTTTSVLQITGGADLAEPFAVNEETNVEPGTVVILEDDNPGGLRVANGAYDPLVVGVISGAGGIQPGLIMQQETETSVDGEMHPVALTGKVYVKAVGPVQIGDLLTTADLPGHAMAATDREQAFGATLGKAMSSLDTGETGLALVLVALQ